MRSVVSFKSFLLNYIQEKVASLSLGKLRKEHSSKNAGSAGFLPKVEEEGVGASLVALALLAKPGDGY